MSKSTKNTLIIAAVTIIAAVIGLFNLSENENYSIEQNSNSKQTTQVGVIEGDFNFGGKLSDDQVQE